jgi:hypothetical protein
MRLQGLGADGLQVGSGDCRKFCGVSVNGFFRICSLTGRGRVAWVLRLVEVDAEGEGQATDVMAIERPCSSATARMALMRS